MNRPLKVFDDREAPEPFIGPAVSRPLLLLTKSIRSEQAYSEDQTADAFGLEVIRRATSCIDGSPFVFFTSPRPELRSRVRTKKGLLWGYPDMNGLEARHGELESSDKYTSLTTLVCLENHRFNDPDTFILDWYRSVLLVSTLPINQLFLIAQKWVRSKVEGVIPLDFDRVFSDLELVPNTAVLRYFAADNGRDESIAVVGHENLLNARAIDCLNRLG